MRSQIGGEKMGYTFCLKMQTYILYMITLEWNAGTTDGQNDLKFTMSFQQPWLLLDVS
jgi:hypothetical protein